MVWDSLPATSADILQKLQNRAARAITRDNYEVRSSSIFQKLDWIRLSQRRFHHKAIAMFKILDTNGPKCLKELFRIKNSPYNFRQDKHLYLPKPRTGFMKRALPYDGAQLWNALPTCINDIIFQKGAAVYLALTCWLLCLYRAVYFRTL